MRLAALTLVSGLVAAASAHFHLQFPGPRGPFNMENELTFCDNYGQVTTNRTTFPLSGGFYSLTSEHPLWVLGVIISTVPDPDNFSDFKTSSGQEQLVVQYFETSGEGAFCAPIDIAAAGISGVKDGANATLQFIFDGGDGQLYQCADITLQANYTIPSDISCTNATKNGGVTVFSTGTVPTITASSTSSSSTQTSGASMRAGAGLASVLLAVGGVAFAMF
ncbi:hypothetical protein WOLCODRAFT_22017 [Wolfiporia cocos MD-104 SS10]|uniref:Copper acquisition factor BIM1-like domain-containing protein n=1 Tax=Wolfiporia cocos (strain MD-104) TaxID=742152 RepID=A0A2H3J3X4_WOLCO|nr:hypothetical protein WOLCODRAFT_22017 [Wolfiporia cocos MD-104 SS10]